ncbi:MAG: tetratricopeptide repeat protein [Acidobacteria bacterium]|nr:tetratricopeptide repeat protein [Acidobacteriota bacterium]
MRTRRGPRRSGIRRQRAAPLVAAAAAVGLFAAGCESQQASEALTAAAPQAGEPTGPITFSRDVAPIVFEHCAPCHRPGGSGPFSLLGYDDAARRARQIAEVTASRFMPPWLPEAGYGEFVGERRLTESQIATLAGWSDSGAAEGDLADLPEPPAATDGWMLGEPDLTVGLPAPYTLPADGSDVFRNLVLPLPVTETRWVRTVELLPGNPQFVHHAIMAVDDTTSSRRREAEETEQAAEPGFSGMEMGLAFMPDGHLMGWTPGMAPNPGIDGLSWRLDPGTDFVVQLHMLPSGRPETIEPVAGFHFADGPPSGPPLYLIRLDADHLLDIPPGDAEFVVTDEVTLPIDVELHAVYPHAHYLAKSMEGKATLPDGAEQWLIRIDDWDFNWQDVYRVREPYVLPAGTTLSMRFTYDNSADNPRNPSDPPQHVGAGNQSSDEMAHLQLQVRPRRAADLVLLRESLYRHAITRNPANPWSYYELGNALLEQDRVDEAAQQYLEGLAVDPTHVASRAGLGALRERQGRLEEAASEFRAATELDPGYAAGHYNLGSVRLDQGRLVEAVGHLRDTLALEPNHAAAHTNLGHALRELGQLDEAVAHHREALRLRPDSAEAHNNLGSALAVSGLLDEAIEHFQSALRLEPGHTEARENLELAHEIAAELERAGLR